MAAHTPAKTTAHETPTLYRERLITERDAAAFLNFSVKTLRNWRVSGRGPKFVRASSNAVRYRLKDLIAWSEERLVESTSEVPGA